VRRPAGARAWRELGRTRPRGRRLRVPQRRCAGERAVRVCCGEGAQTRRARAGAAGASRPRDPRRATARRALIMPAVPPDAASCSPLLRAAPQRAACATRGLGLLPRRENKKNMFFQKKPDWDKAADCYQKAAQIYRSSSVRRMRARARAHFRGVCGVMQCSTDTRAYWSAHELCAASARRCRAIHCCGFACPCRRPCVSFTLQVKKGDAAVYAFNKVQNPKNPHP